MKEMKTKTGKMKRIEFIDLAKGICILLVVLEHIRIPIDLPGLRAMLMPLFFILSGLFFKGHGNFMEFLVKKTNKILIPFLFFYLVAYAAFYLFQYFFPGLIVTDAQGLLDIFIQRQYFNGPIWFLLCLFWVNLIFYIILHHVTKEWKRAIYVIIIGAAGIYCAKSNVIFPCVIDISFTALPFFYFGYLLKKTSILYNNKYDKYNIFFVFVFYFIAWSLDKYFQPSLDLHYNHIRGNILVLFMMCIANVMSVFFLCKIIKYLPFISYFGKYSIIPLCVHHLVYRPIQLIFYNLNIVNNLAGVAVVTVLICWACIPLCIKYIPYFTAQKNLINIKNEQ
jgi:fucose 4-O-acetylase-like acetyltransferase